MKISVVTITYNNFDELIKTLSSVEKRDYIESVVINGGSCEKTQDFLENEFDGVCLSEKDEGISDAFNKGAKLSSGDLIVFLNSGDYLIDQAYYDEVIKIFKTEDIDYTFTDIKFVDNYIGETYFKYEEKSLGRGSPYFHQSFVMKRSTLEEIGNFDLSFKIAMDYDLFVRLKKAKKKGKYIPRATVLMDGTGISASNEIDSIKECFRSLSTNKMLNIENYLGISIRLTLFYIRKLIQVIGGNQALAFLKKKKYKN